MNQTYTPHRANPLTTMLTSGSGSPPNQKLNRTQRATTIPSTNFQSNSGASKGSQGYTFKTNSRGQMEKTGVVNSYGEIKDYGTNVRAQRYTTTANPTSYQTNGHASMTPNTTLSKQYRNKPPTAPVGLTGLVSSEYDFNSNPKSQVGRSVVRENRLGMDTIYEGEKEHVSLERISNITPVRDRILAMGTKQNEGYLQQNQHRPRSDNADSIGKPKDLKDVIKNFTPSRTRNKENENYHEGKENILNVSALEIANKFSAQDDNHHHQNHIIGSAIELGGVQNKTSRTNSFHVNVPTSGDSATFANRNRLGSSNFPIVDAPQSSYHYENPPTRNAELNTHLMSTPKAYDATPNMSPNFFQKNSNGSNKKVPTNKLKRPPIAGADNTNKKANLNKVFDHKMSDSEVKTTAFSVTKKSDLNKTTQVPNSMQQKTNKSQSNYAGSKLFPNTYATTKPSVFGERSANQNPRVGMQKNTSHNYMAQNSNAK